MENIAERRGLPHPGLSREKNDEEWHRELRGDE
jgi:hypothetical protein